MGILDKIKNALFEVEYVEVEEKPKKEKKVKQKEQTTEKEDKPIAKKIVLPGKIEEKVEEIKEEELKDEDFEVRPKDEKVKEVFQDNFNVMGDDYPTAPVPPVTEPVYEEVPPATIPTVPPETTPATQPIAQDGVYTNKDYVREYDSYKEKVYNTLQNEIHVKKPESRPYGMDLSHRVAIKEYGAESREEKGTFKPSPIISPIYGILDKNYKKEDVVAKKEVHHPTYYSKASLNVDDIRNKAYGSNSQEEFQEEKTHEIVLEDDDENLLVDLSDEKKPEVKEITVGDAMEYFQDLGLEYNVDYVDASGKTPPKKKPDDLEEDIKDTMNESVEEVVVPETVPVPVPAPATEPVVAKVESAPVEEKPAAEATLDDDDNLFDLIDSMYHEEDN